MVMRPGTNVERGVMFGRLKSTSISPGKLNLTDVGGVLSGSCLCPGAIDRSG